jgi:hypothetical protein
MGDYLLTGGLLALGLKFVILLFSHIVAYRLGYSEGVGRWLDYAIVLFPMKDVQDGEVAHFMGESQEDGQ